MTDPKISFSIEIANTIGLEEAILLEYLKENESLDKISLKQINAHLGFWTESITSDLLNNLIKRGLVMESNLGGTIYFSSRKPNQVSKPIIENTWMPEKEVFDQITEYGIPEDFANLHIDDFKKLNEERNQKDKNWGVKFLRFVIKKWRHQEVEENKKKKMKPMEKTWLPDDDALEILIKSGINEDFIDKEIPEFILYWTERKEDSDIWNSKFIAHIRRQWGRFKDVKENDNLPSKMTSEWRPNEDFFDILELTDIPREFAENTKPEFIMYWKETGQSLNSWNSKFLQHVKYNWEKTNKGQTPQLSDQIDRRIESSWKIEESSLKRAPQPDNEMIQEKFKKLKEKHQI